MTNKQLDMVIGSLLGDGYLIKSSSRSKNAMFKLKQCDRFSSYVNYFYNGLEDYVQCGVRTYTARKPSRNKSGIDHSKENWNGEHCVSKYFWSKCNPVFTDLYEEWYEASPKRKRVPNNIVLNPRRLAHWFVEDGHNASKHSKGIILSTHSFSETECGLLIQSIKSDLNMDAKLYKGPKIRIPAKHYFDFIDLVTPYVQEFGCFDYKIDTSQAPADRKGKGWNGPVLNMDKAKEIRRLKKEGKSTKDLAAQFEVGLASINKIINNKMYVEKDQLTLSGKAAVGRGYKYGN